MAIHVLSFDWQEQAVSTYNFLCEEKRYVAGAFIPPTKVDTVEDEVYLVSGDRTPEHDMITVLQRMAKMKGQEFDKLPDITDDKNQQWLFRQWVTLSFAKTKV